MESVWKGTQATNETRIMMDEKRITMLEAQVASHIGVAGCDCKEKIVSKGGPKKIAVAIDEQACTNQTSAVCS